jgi:glycogen(starch) synthase
LEELERAGAEAWVGTMSVERRDTYSFPPSERLVVCPPPPVWRRGLDRLVGRSGAERLAGRLATRMAALEPTLVHAQFGWAAGTGVALARRLGVPSVATFHGTDVTTVPVERPGSEGWRGPPGHPYEAMFGELRTAFAVSEFIAGLLRGLGYEGEIEIVPAGVHLDRLPFRGEEPPPDDPLLMYVGRINRQKGLDVLLRALPAVRAAHPRARLEVLGGGESREEFERLAGELGLGQAVTFLGPLPRREDVLEALQRAHVQVMPSRAMPDGAAEGSPVVPKESQAVGVPLVTTDAGGTRETVPPEHRGELAPPDDPDALAAAVIRLLDDHDLRAERARRARAWVEEQFDARAIARRTVAIYERIAASPSGFRPAAM